MDQWIPRYLRLNMLKNPYPTLNVNISGSNDPIGELFFRPYRPDQGLSNEPKIIENGSVNPEIFASKDSGTKFDGHEIIIFIA